MKKYKINFLLIIILILIIFYNLFKNTYNNKKEGIDINYSSEQKPLKDYCNVEDDDFILGTSENGPDNETLLDKTQKLDDAINTIANYIDPPYDPTKRNCQAQDCWAGDQALDDNECRNCEKSKAPRLTEIENCLTNFNTQLAEYYKNDSKKFLCKPGKGDQEKDNDPTDPGCNTSFNLKGQPIVESPRDALMTFYGCGLDTLIMGKYIIRKHNSTN